MAVDFYAEVWPVPGTTPWVPRLDSLDWHVLSATKRNGLGSGSFQIPVGSSQLNQILYKDPDNPANDIESLIRVYRAGDPIPDYEFFADNAPNLLVEQGTLQFSGGGVESELDKLRVLPFDYPRRPTLDPHWLFGSDRNAIRNGGFEDNPLAITNQGFEDGTREPWWPGAVEGVNATVVIVTGANVDTGTFAAEIDPLTAEGGISTSIRTLPDTEYTVTARVKAGIGVDYQLGASGPEAIVPLSGAIFATAFGDGFYGPGQKHEAQTLFVSTGAYQTVTLQFRTAPNQTSTQISVREGEAVLNGQLFYLDVVTVAGNGVGVSPWQSAGVTTFQASSAQFDTGAWSGHIVGANPASGSTVGGYVFQRMNGFTPGATYTATARVRSPVASRLWALEVRDVTGALIAQDALSLAANTWTSLSVTFQAPLFIPGPDRALEFRIVNYSSVAADLFLDAVFMIQGQAAATVGEIMQQLMDDVNVNHTAEAPPFDVPGKPWITYTTFTSTLDSNGNAWADSDISITIREGTRYSDVLGNFVRLGYEWELLPDPVTDGQWRLLIYNPGGKGSTLPDEIGLVAGSADIGGPVARSRIPANWIFTRGAGGVFDVTDSAASLGAVGFQMGYYQALDIDDEATAALRGAEQLSANIDAGISLQLELAPTDPDQLIPGRDFTVGDALSVTVPGVIVRGVRRCESHTVTLKADPGDEAPLTFVVSFLSENYASGGGGVSVGSADNRIARGLELVMRKLERVEDAAQAESDGGPVIVGGAGGAAPDLVIAGSNSIQSSKDRADFVCSGTGDAAVINQAAALLTAGGRILLTGTFNCTETLTVPTGVSLVGMGWEATKLVFTAVTVAGEAIGLGVRSNLHNLKVDISGSPGGFVRAIDLGVESRMSGVWVESDVGVGIADSGGENYITGCHIDGTMTTAIEVVSGGVIFISDTFIESAPLGVTITGGGECVITNCVMECDDVAVQQTGNATLRVSNSFLRGFDVAAVEIFSSTVWATFTGCHIRSLGSAPGVILRDTTGNAYVNLTGNTFDVSGSGVVIDAFTSNAKAHIVGNTFDTPSRHGVQIIDSSGHFVLGNFIVRPGGATTNTYDGIILEGDSDDNTIMGNRIDPSLVSFTTRNGVNVSASTCDCNIVVGNVLGDPANYGTDALNDAGTDTQKFWPNDATYGDNFTICISSS